jgi:septal ring factor EnvC (AmiA/AmiB activator)
MLKFKLLFLMLSISFVLFGQSDKRKELEKQKTVLQQEINYVNKLIKENKKAAKFSLSQLKNLEIKISIREDLIANYNREIQYLDESILSKKGEIDSLEQELLNLREEYSKIVVQSYKSKSSNNRILFLLSSDNFNQALKRLKYMEQIAEYRVLQGEKIKTTKSKLEKTLELYKDEKVFKLNLVSLKELEKTSLEDELTQKTGFVDQLNSQAVKLKKEITDKQRKSDKLQSEIQKIIAEEIRIAKEKAKKENAKNNSSIALTKEAKELSKKFENNKDKLPWPLEKGYVVSKYGKHKHPTLKNITIVNHGVDIATEKGAKARSIFSGEVSSVIISRGGNRTVIIQHGNFYTVYSNLGKIYVSKGQKVSLKQDIGEVYFNSRTGDSILKFQLWKDDKEQNPANWIYKM